MRLVKPGLAGFLRPFLWYESTKLAFNFHSCHLRRERHRLPPSLLIENASAEVVSAPQLSCAEAFPIKASDDPPEAVAKHCGVMGMIGALSRSDKMHSVYLRQPE